LKDNNNTAKPITWGL